MRMSLTRLDVRHGLLLVSGSRCYVLSSDMLLCMCTQTATMLDFILRGRSQNMNGSKQHLLMNPLGWTKENVRCFLAHADP